SIQDVDETVGPSYADLKTIAQNTKKSADGVIAYTGKPAKDKHGNWVRDDDGRVVFTDSEHTRAMKKLKNEYKDLVAKIDRHRGGVDRVEADLCLRWISDASRNSGMDDGRTFTCRGCGGRGGVRDECRYRAVI